MSSRQVGISSVDAVGSVGTYSVGTHLRLVQKINMEMIFFLSKYLYTQIHTYYLSMCTMYIQVPAFFFLPLISLSLFLSSQNFQSFTLFTITIEKHNKAQYFNVPTVVYHYIFFYNTTRSLPWSLWHLLFIAPHFLHEDQWAPFSYHCDKLYVSTGNRTLHLRSAA